jgi:DNA adenine methylase
MIYDPKFGGQSMHLFSPLRYPGGKGKLAPFIQNVFRYNNLCDGIYIEPYAGGSAVALSLLLQGYAWNIIINDIDPFVHAFWWSVLNETDAISKKIKDTRITMTTWKRQKEIYTNPLDHSLIDLGFATFFLNRTNRSGILEGGVIGGKDQTGPFKIDARFNKKELLQRIALIATYKGRIELYCKDAFELISKIRTNLPSKCLIYFDPPYFKKGKMLYKNFYKPCDHANMANLIRSLECPWIVTYDNVDEIKSLYDGEKDAEFDIAYSANLERTRGAEIMFYRNLCLPSLPYTRKEDGRFSNAPITQ